MKFNKILSLVVSTCLITSPLMAGRTPEPLTDAYNWKGVPAKEKREEWHKNTGGALSKRAEELAQEYKQAESLFAPYTRRGDKRVRTIANAVCDTLSERAQRAQYSSELFAGYGEEGPTESLRNTAAQTSTPLPTFGRHTDLTRKVAETKAEIEKCQKTLQAQPEENKKSTARLAVLQNEAEQMRPALAKATQTTREKKEALETTGGSLTKASEKLQEAQENLNGLTSEKVDQEAELKANLNAFDKETSKLQERLASIKEDEVQESPSLQVQIAERSVQREALVAEQVLEIAAFNERATAQATLVEGLKTELEKRKGFQAGAQQHLEKAEEAERALRDKLAANEKETQEHQTILSSQEQQKAKIVADLKELTSRQQNLQDEADAIAIGKYILYNNLHKAVTDFMAEVDTTCSTVDPHDMPLVESILDQLAKAHADHRAKVDNFQKQAYTHLWTSFALQNDKSDSYVSNFATHIESGRTYYYTSADLRGYIEERFKSAVKKGLHNSFTLLPLEAEKDVHKEFQDELERLRLDNSLQTTANEWKALITKERGSLAHRLGLSSSLLNETFQEKTREEIFSYAHLLETCPELKDFEAEEGALDESVIWERAQFQLERRYVKDLTHPNSPVHARIIPVYDFVEAKATSSFSPSSPNETKVDSTEKTFWETLTQMVSFMSMHYALTHDENGEKIETPPTKILGVEIPVKERVDMLMARSAHRLYRQLKENFETQLDALGLKASLFAPLVQKEDDSGELRKSK